MPSEQPKPVLALIAVIALIAMAGSIYVGVTSQLAAGHPPAAAAAH